MDIDTIQTLVDEVRATGVEVGCETAVSDDEIDRLQSLLSVTLPDEYRVFLREFGAMWSDESTVSGVMSGDVAAEELGSTFCDTRRYRDDFDMPNHLVVIQPNEDAPYCIDTSAISGNVAPVVCFQLNTASYQPISKSFEEFLTDWFLQPLTDNA